MIDSIEVTYLCGHVGIERKIKIDNTPDMIAKFLLSASERKCPLCSYKRMHVMGKNIHIV